MTALTAKAALVDTAAFEGGGAIATSVPRADIEEALASGTTSEFFLDLARERDGEREAEQRIIVTWEQDDLKKLLQSTTGDEVTFAFKPDELARAFDEPDVEAQGLRERMAVLTIAATTVAGVSAGVASATVANPQGEAGSGGTTAAFVTDSTSSGPQATAEAGTAGQFLTDATSSGPQASTEEGTVSNLVTDTTSSGPQSSTEEGTVSNFVTDTTSSAGPALEGLTPAQQLAEIESTGDTSSAQFVTDATSSGPQASTEPGTVSNLVTDATSSGPREATEAASAGGGGESFIESRGGEAVLAGGFVLLLLGAGFVAARQRRGVQPA